jgi:hypothetical protein
MNRPQSEAGGGRRDLRSFAAPLRVGPKRAQTMYAFGSSSSLSWRDVYR